MAKQICIAVLAAGRATRFGGAKLLEEWAGRPLLQHALLAARAACPGNVWLVTGHDSDAIASAAAGLADRIVSNADFRDGIGTSIARAAVACRDTGDALMILLADQPLISASHLNELISAWKGDSDLIVASGYAGTLGPPVLFGRKYFADLEQLKGDSGAKEILSANPHAVAVVDFEPAAIDIDTPADLDALDKC